MELVEKRYVFIGDSQVKTVIKENYRVLINGKRTKFFLQDLFEKVLKISTDADGLILEIIGISIIDSDKPFGNKVEIVDNEGNKFLLSTVSKKWIIFNSIDVEDDYKGIFSESIENINEEYLKVKSKALKSGYTELKISDNEFALINKEDLSQSKLIEIDTNDEINEFLVSEVKETDDENSSLIEFDNGKELKIKIK